MTRAIALDAARETYSTGAANTFTPDLGGVRSGVLSGILYEGPGGEEILIDEDDSPATGAKATATLTFSATIGDYDLVNDFVTVENIRFYPKAVGSLLSKYDFEAVSGDAATTAQNFLDAFNKTTQAKKRLTAQRAGAVITFTSKEGGAAFNAPGSLALRLATTDATAMAVTAFSGGTQTWRTIHQFPVGASNPVDFEPEIEFHRGVRMRTSGGGNWNAGSGLSIRAAPARRVPINKAE